MSPEHVQLRDSLLRRLADVDASAAWSELRDAGVLGLFAPEAAGGLDLPVDALEPVFDALGSLGLGPPCLETTVIASGLLRRLPPSAAHDLQRRIAEGAVVAVAGIEAGLGGGLVVRGPAEQARLSGVARIVVGAMEADALLVVAEQDGRTGLFLAADGWRDRRRAVPTIDGRMAADISFDETPVVRLGQLEASALEAVLDEAVVAICVEASALMKRLVRDTVNYAKQREQFGQAIGQFQVVQHRLVDMNIQARRAAAISSRAVQSLDGPDADRARIVSAAKVTICRAGRLVGQDAVQLHGGMGMTEDLSVGRLFKRLTVIEAQLGSADTHLRRFQALQSAA